MLRSELSSFTVYWRLVWCLGTRKRMYSVLWLVALSIFGVICFSETDMVRTLPDSQDVVEVSPWIRLPKILYAATFPLLLASRVWPLGILETGAAIMQNTMEIAPKIKNKDTIWSSNSIPWYIRKENENTNSKIYMNPNVHSSIVYNSQGIKASEESINKWEDREDV